MEEHRAKALRQSWDSRVDSWSHQVSVSPAFQQILKAVLLAADPADGDAVVDLGAGTGFVTLPIASQVQSVLAVDISAEMLEELERRAKLESLTNISTLVGDLATLSLAEKAFSLVVSNYTLHHLSDDQKIAVLGKARRWLQPGGRLVIADMMFGRGGTAQDRLIIRQKVAALAKKGPAGMWRIARNVVRFGMRKGTDLPVPPQFWVEQLERVGFVDVKYQPIVSEAGLVTARAPD